MQMRPAEHSPHAVQALALICAMSLAISCIFDVPIGQTTVTVNTASLYDALGITGLMKEEALPSGDVILTDSLLIYDLKGQLVAKLGEECDNLNPVIFEIAGLPDGSYTLVALQAAYLRTLDEKPWVISGEELLSTASLTTIYDCFAYPYAAGFATADVSIYGGSVDVDLSPMPIGCLVDFRIDNFTPDTGFEAISLVTSDSEGYAGIRLNPSLSERDRWISVEFNSEIGSLYLGEERELLFTLCHGDEITSHYWGIAGDEEQFIETMVNQNMSVGGQYVSFFDLNRKSWQPPFFGSAGDYKVWKADRDAGLLVADPVLEWGCNFDEVERHIQAKNWWMDGNHEFEYWEDEYITGWHRWYYVAPALTEQYIFETEDGRNLRYAYVNCWNSPCEVARISLLQHGFVYKGQIQIPDDSRIIDFYLSPDGQTEALLGIYGELNWDITYQPTDPNDFQYLVTVGEG